MGQAADGLGLRFGKNNIMLIAGVGVGQRPAKGRMKNPANRAGAWSLVWTIADRVRAVMQAS